MSLNSVSNAGHYEVFNAFSPAWGRLSDGYAYSVAIINNTDADVTTGTYAFEGAASKEGDACSPDDLTWQPLVDYPACDANPGSVEGAAKITFTAASPLPARGQCHYAIACPEPFIRVTGPATAGINVLAVVTRLKRVGGV